MTFFDFCYRLKPLYLKQIESKKHRDELEHVFTNYLFFLLGHEPEIKYSENEVINHVFKGFVAELERSFEYRFNGAVFTEEDFLFNSNGFSNYNQSKKFILGR